MRGNLPNVGSDYPPPPPRPPPMGTPSIRSPGVPPPRPPTTGTTSISSPGISPSGAPPAWPLPVPPRLPPKQATTSPIYELVQNQKPDQALYDKLPLKPPSQNQNSLSKSQQKPSEAKSKEKTKKKDFLAIFNPMHRESKEEDTLDGSYNKVYEPFSNSDGTCLLGNSGISKGQSKPLKSLDKMKDKPLPFVPSQGQVKREIKGSYPLPSGAYERPLPPLPTTSQATSPTLPSPMPQLPCRRPSAISVSSDTTSNGSDGEDDFYENEDEDFCDNDEEYFSKLGIDVKESERIYLSTTTILPALQNQIPSALAADINKLLVDEHRYLTTIGEISEARKILNPRLQGLLQGVDKLVDVHHNMYTELYAGYHSCSKVAQVFLSRKDDLAPYSYYLMNAPAIGKELQALQEGVTAQYPNLKTNIMTSWKRLNFYFLSLENLLENAPAEEAKVVEQAVEMFKEMSRKGDSGILMDAVKGAPFSLHTLSPLLLHSIFSVKLANRNKGDCRVLLFCEMIILTIPKKDHCEYVDHLPTNQLQWGAADDDCDTQFTLEMIRGGKKKNKRYTFRSPTVAIKDAWISKITELLNKHADEIKRIAGLRYGKD